MNASDIVLSKYGGLSSEPSPVNRMMASFSETFREGVDINLGVGYVNERTIPKTLILDAMRTVLDNPEHHRFPLNYGGSKGSDNLIDAIRRFHVGNGIGGLNAELFEGLDIIIGPNGATSLLEGISHILPAGIVITSDPMYYIYCDYLMRRGFDIIAVPEDEHGIDTVCLERKLNSLGNRRRENIRFFYCVTVNNPSATILSNNRRRRIVEIACALSNDLERTVPVFFDRAYESLIHDPSVPPPQSGFLHDTCGVVFEIGTLSKILAPALRIGYMIGPKSPFMRAMVQKTNDAGFSAPLISQEIAAVLLESHVAAQIDAVNEGYREKARIVGRCIGNELGRYLESVRGGQAGFYYYLTFKDIETTERSPFFRFLARTTGIESVDGQPSDMNPRVIYVPGEFCVHPNGDLTETGKRQLRLSYGFEEIDAICRAVGYMREAADYVSGV